MKHLYISRNSSWEILLYICIKGPIVTCIPVTDAMFSFILQHFEISIEIMKCDGICIEPSEQIDFAI